MLSLPALGDHVVPDVYRRLMDAVDPDLTATAETTLRQTDGVRDIEHRLRWIEHRLRVEAGIVVERSLDIVAAHAIATDAHHRLLHAISKLVGATVHVSPSDAAATRTSGSPKPRVTAGLSTTQISKILLSIFAPTRGRALICATTNPQ